MVRLNTTAMDDDARWAAVMARDQGADGQFVYGAPQAPGAPVPEEFKGREAEFTTIGGN